MSISSQANDFHQVKDELYIYDNCGKQLERLFPDFVGSMTAHCRDTHSWLFITMSGFTTPGTIAYYDFKKPEGQRITTFRRTKVKGINPDEFETRQVCPDCFHRPERLLSGARFGMLAKMVPKSLCSLFATNPRPSTVLPLLSSTVRNVPFHASVPYLIYYQDMEASASPSTPFSILCSSRSSKSTVV